MSSGAPDDDAEGVRLVDLTRDLIPATIACAHAAWHAAYDDLLPSGQVDYMLAQRATPEVLAGYLGATDRWFQLAVTPAADVIGYSSCRRNGPSRLRLEQIYLLPGRWGGGVADLLLDAVVQRARDLAADVVDLTVNKGNLRAQRFYRRRGFVRTEEVVMDIGGGFVMDDFVWELTVAGGQ